MNLQFTHHSWPFPYEIDAAPHLLVIALARLALCATRTALDSAHPIIDAAGRRRATRELRHTESIAQRIIDASLQLAALLGDYEAAVRGDLDDSLNPIF